MTHTQFVTASARGLPYGLTLDRLYIVPCSGDLVDVS